MSFLLQNLHKRRKLQLKTRLDLVMLETAEHADLQ